MTNVDISDHEREILDFLENILVQFTPFLKEVGLTYQVGKFRISGMGMSYESEINIDFCENKNIVDVIEFFYFY